jgi:hypothetical protein
VPPREDRGPAYDRPQQEQGRGRGRGTGIKSLWSLAWRNLAHYATSLDASRRMGTVGFTRGSQAIGVARGFWVPQDTPILSGRSRLERGFIPNPHDQDDSRAPYRWDSQR